MWWVLGIIVFLMIVGKAMAGSRSNMGWFSGPMGVFFLFIVLWSFLFDPSIYGRSSRKKKTDPILVVVKILFAILVCIGIYSLFWGHK
jgi:hypothetical protein